MPSIPYPEQARVPLPGSERKPFNALGNPRLPFVTVEPESVKVLPKSRHLTISVLVKRKTPLDSTSFGTQVLTHEQFAERHGADPDAVAAVKQFAEAFNLQVEPEIHESRRTVQLTGSVEAMEKAFGTTLSDTKTAHGDLRVRQGPLTVPEELAPHLVAVLGLDNRPQTTPHNRLAIPRSTNISYTPVQVASLYNFPATGGAGQTIGLIELGGGFKQADLEIYFRALSQNPPTVNAISVDKAKNKPSGANGADGEVLLDIEVAAAVAPGVSIAVYFAPNTDQGFTDAISTAVHDTSRKPGVISISWGGPESTWTQQAITAMDEACQAAAALGITITVACGDSGATDGVTDGANHVDFPASSPHVLACGGTKLVGTGAGIYAKITSEVVWNELANNEGATGGGVSDVFPLPTWQAQAKVPAPTVSGGGRGLPDVSGNADPATGYSVRVDGENTVIGGTSAVAPLWAGLITVINAAKGKTSGFLNPTLYAAKESSAFHDITSGTNGAFIAGPGWDACAGLGTPIGTGVQTVLGGTPVHTTGKPVKSGDGLGDKRHHN